MLPKLIPSLALSISLVLFSSAWADSNNTSTTKETPKTSISKTLQNLPSSQTTPQTPTAQTSQATLINQIVAVVNNGVITSQQLDEAVEQTKAQLNDQGIALPNELTLKRQVLQQLINQTIILELAKRNHITVTDNDVNQLIQSIADQNHITVAQLKQKLETNGISYQQYTATLHKQLTIQKMQQKLVSGSIFISPNDINHYVEKNLKQPEIKHYDLSNIVIPLPSDKSPNAIEKAKQSAVKLVNEIKSGKITFFDAARKYSQSGNALSGGSLGVKTLDELPSIYQARIKTMKPKEISGPFEANGALQILQLNAITTNAPEKHWVEQYHVEQILLKLTPILNNDQAKAQLERVITALNNGESFASLAKANTQNYDAASKGGDLGWINLSQVDPKLAETIQNTPKNKVSAPFQVNNTWQIIKVLGERKVDNTEDYLRMQAANILYRQRAEQMVKNWQLSVRGEAYVKILIPELNMPELENE